MPHAIEKDIIVKRINGIEQEMSELKELAAVSLEEFASGVNFKLAQYHLHRALEGVFNISTHILSRIPGGQATQYKEIALKLGEFGLVEKKFAKEKLTRMAGYRNRLVHFYAEVTPEELYGIVQNDLGDLSVFLTSVKDVLENPQRFGLVIE